MNTNNDRSTAIAELERQLTQLVAHCAAPDAELERRYAPGKWSARQLLAHLADVEFINYWRFCRAVAEPGSTVESFDEARWERVLDYASRPVAVSRAMIAGMRAALLHHAKTLSDATLANACTHPEKGRMSGFEWLTLMVAHTEHHLGQIAAAREARTWSPTLTPDSWKYGAKPIS
jgi:uncharacterized damage-inducible protein DinB